MDDLQRDIRSLSAMLEDVVSTQAGERAHRLIRTLRRLSRERRALLPGAEQQLVERISELSIEDFRTAVPALIIFFDLANMAEDTQRVRVLRERERQIGDAPRDESLRAAVHALKAKGLSSHEIQRLLDRLSVDLVFTAHPTEAKRRTTRRLIRSLREDLQQLNRSDVLPREKERLLARMRSDLTILYQIDLLRPQRPTVMQEVARGLFFVEELWKVVPEIDRELQAAASELSRQAEPLHPFLKFGSWIGGDRDGNPFVTASVTAETLKTLRRAAIRRHQATTDKLYRLLVMSDRSVAIPQRIREAIEAAITRWPGLKEVLASNVTTERYRQWLRIIEWRLGQSLTYEMVGALPPGAYSRSEELAADVMLLADCIRSHKGESIAEGYLDDWIAQVRTFGLHFAALDVRQDSRVHIDVLTELFKHLGECEDYSRLEEPQKRELLCSTMNKETLSLAAFDSRSFAEMTVETLNLFRLLATTMWNCGSQSLGGHVISMTHDLSDVLAVLWLWQAAWREATASHPGGQSAAGGYLPIIPLFETIDDLERADEVLDELLSDPTYRRYLESAPCETTQTVMVGYSDSTKDGGYLAASWWLHQAQERLAEVAGRFGVRLIIFHGRGGALGRGGGPAARAILSLPPRAVDGALRVTEQGEVLAERYDDPHIAHRHLEQVSWATLLVSASAGAGPDPSWLPTLDGLAGESLKCYRELVEHPGFLGYFDRGTPISDIESLPIGSRPARRRERRSLADLRAIPWTFAWTQSRHMIPAWYGLGFALNHFSAERGGDWTELQKMYNGWPLFRAIIDNAELALAKADMGIARRYAELADREGSQDVWELIFKEYERSRASVLLVTRQNELLEAVPWLQRSIRERNPYVDPLNLMQIELIRRLRAVPEEDADTAEQLRNLIRLTIQGVAAGLRTTG